MRWHWHSFPRTLAFALLAASAWLAIWVVLGPVLGTTHALGLFLIGLVALYVAGIAPSWRRGLAVALPASGACLAFWLLTRSVSELAVFTAIAIAVARSGFLYRSRFGRGLAIELLLGSVGLGLVALLVGSGVVGIACSIWGYFLVQSVFFLIAGVRLRSTESQGVDPFDQARQALLLLLERDGL